MVVLCNSKCVLMDLMDLTLVVLKCSANFNSVPTYCLTLLSLHSGSQYFKNVCQRRANSPLEWRPISASVV